MPLKFNVAFVTGCEKLPRNVPSAAESDALRLGAPADPALVPMTILLAAFTVAELATENDVLVSKAITTGRGTGAPGRPRILCVPAT